MGKKKKSGKGKKGKGGKVSEHIAVISTPLGSSCHSSCFPQMRPWKRKQQYSQFHLEPLLRPRRKARGRKGRRGPRQRRHRLVSPARMLTFSEIPCSKMPRHNPSRKDCAAMGEGHVGVAYPESRRARSCSSAIQLTVKGHLRMVLADRNGADSRLHRYTEKAFHPVFEEQPWQSVLERTLPFVKTEPARSESLVGDAETMVKLLLLLIRNEGGKKEVPDDVHTVAASIRCVCDRADR